MRGSWHGDTCYFGFHYDRHARESDMGIGDHATKEELTAHLKAIGADFVQTDCKGHPGITSWFSKTPDASVVPDLKRDLVEGWRAASEELGLPLHCHYSGIWDKAAMKKHPEWSVVPSAERAGNGGFAGNPGEMACPRSDYARKLMIPQMMELIDRYRVDGFWIDGEIWAVHPCYCERCVAAYNEQTGLSNPPKSPDEEGWTEWMLFTRESFYEHVTAYCEAVHEHKPEVKICSNWLQTFRDPGEPSVPTDWISGDNTWVYGLDDSRCEARFLSTREKHWDVMLWAQTSAAKTADGSSPMTGGATWTIKPVPMLLQEAAVVLSFGGAVQVYDPMGSVRDGRLVPWRVERLAQAREFVHARRELCQGSVTVPQIAVLHSEHHLYRNSPGVNLLWGTDTAPVKGATFACIENHLGTDLLDEWALLRRIGEFPIVVAPEQHLMSDEMVAALTRYVRGGGRLLITGADSYDRFGEELIGAADAGIAEAESYHVAVGGISTAVYGKKWRRLTATTASVDRLLETNDIPGDAPTSYPAVLRNSVAGGEIIYVPFDLFATFERERHWTVRALVGELLAEWAAELPFAVSAPTGVDVAFRRLDGKTVVHLVNRLSGVPNTPVDGTVDEVPPVGPITITVKDSQAPKSVEAVFETASVDYRYDPGMLTIVVDRVHIHTAVVIETVDV